MMLLVWDEEEYVKNVRKNWIVVRNVFTTACLWVKEGVHPA